MTTVADPDASWVELVKSVKLDEYSVGDLRGGGGFGLVFEGMNADKTRVVALKVLNPGRSSSESVHEFEREGLLLKILQKSSNVVDLIYTGQASVPLEHGSGIQVEVPIRFHVLELSSGSLDELVENLSQLSWVERLNLWRGIVRGVHQMHLRNIVHRDLKSDNCLLFVRRRGLTDCKVADLGRSRDLSQPTHFGPLDYLQGRGDLRFAPPEFLFLQGADSVSCHKLADLYGLGSLLFELATGQAITSFALGVKPDDVMRAAADLRQNRGVNLNGLRDNYEDAFETFAASVPVSIRDKSTALVRQLCNPDPAQRLPRTGVGKRAPRSTGLEWLIRQADILIRSYSAQAKSLARSNKGV